MGAVAAASSVGAVLESNFYRAYAVDELRALPGPVIETAAIDLPAVAHLISRPGALKQCPTRRSLAVQRSVTCGFARPAAKGVS